MFLFSPGPGDSDAGVVQLQGPEAVLGPAQPKVPPGHVPQPQGRRGRPVRGALGDEPQLRGHSAAGRLPGVLGGRPAQSEADVGGRRHRRRNGRLLRPDGLLRAELCRAVRRRCSVGAGLCLQRGTVHLAGHRRDPAQPTSGLGVRSRNLLTTPLTPNPPFFG